MCLSPVLKKKKRLLYNISIFDKKAILSHAKKTVWKFTQMDFYKNFYPAVFNLHVCFQFLPNPKDISENLFHSYVKAKKLTDS